MPLHSDRWVHNNYFIDSRRNGIVILQQSHPHLWKEVKFALRGFRLYYDEVCSPGGGKSKVTQRMENFFKSKGWTAVEFEELNTLKIGQNLGENNENVFKTITLNSQTHEIDLFKEKIAIEIEWNNKHQFFSRDLEAFNYLYNTGIIDVGIIITRHTSLTNLFESFGYLLKKNPKDPREKSKKVVEKYASTHTRTDKLINLLNSNRCSCPIIVIGITPDTYRMRI